MKIFVMTAVAAVFFSTAALADNITIKCDNDIEQANASNKKYKSDNTKEFNGFYKKQSFIENL